MRFLVVLALLVLPLAAMACGGDDDDTGGDTRQASFEQAEQVTEPGKTYTATVKTTEGDFVVELDAEGAPNTVNSFVFLAREGFFDGITFHRVVEDFVVQAGDPTGAGSGGPGYETKDEPNEVSNTRGTISMAKTPGADEFGSQFFINLKDNTGLDFDNEKGDKFYPFGKIVSGMEVVDKIGAAKVDARGRPEPPIVINTVTVEAK